MAPPTDTALGSKPYAETVLGSANRNSPRCPPCRPTPLSDLSRVGQNVLPHQFRSRNDRIKAQRRRAIQNENAGRSTNLTVILPLITVWLQVRVLTGSPVFASFASLGSASQS